MSRLSVAAVALQLLGCAVGGGDTGGGRAVELLSPSGETPLSGTVQVLAAVRGDAFEEAVLSIDGEEVHRWLDASDGELSTELDTTSLSEGLHELRVRLRAGGEDRESWRVVRIDNAAPALEILEPLEQVFLEDGPFAMVVRLSDASSARVLRVRVDGLLLAEIDAVTRDTLAIEVEPRELLPPGLEVARVRLGVEAEDAEGRLGTTERMIRLASRRAWTFDTLGRVWEAPEILDDGAVAVATSEGVLHVVEPDGTERCHRRADGERGTASPASVPGAGAIVWGTTRALRVISAEDCSVRYTHPQVGEFVARPVVSRDGVIHAVTFDGSFLSFRPDGSDASVLSLADELGGAAVEVRSSPALGPDGSVYQGVRVGTTGGGLVAIRPDGSVDSAPSTAPVEADLVTDGEAIYFGGMDGAAYCHDFDLSRRWVVPLADELPILTRPALRDGAVVLSDGEGTIHALDARTGATSWSYDALLDRSIAGVGLVGRAGIAAGASGELALGDALGMVHVIGAAGAPRFRIQIGSGGSGGGIVARPAVGEERLFVGTENQTLVAIDR